MGTNKLILIILVVIATTVVYARAAQAGVTFYSTKGSFDAAVTTTLLEDFENIPGIVKDHFYASFTHNGVTYLAAPGFNVAVASPGYTNFGAGVGRTTSSILTANGNEDFFVNFSSPLRAVGFDTYLNGLGPGTVKVFNSSVLLDTFTYPGSVNTKEYLGIASTDPITSIRWTTTRGASLNTGIDNMSIALVPEPTALSMVGVSVLAAIRLRPRGRRLFA